MEAGPTLRTAVSTGGSAVTVNDLETGENRTATLGDLAYLSCLTDALDEIDIACCSVTVQDVQPEMAPLRSLEVMLSNTTKPVGMAMTKARQCRGCF